MNILIVEDEVRLAKNIARTLHLESYKTTIAANGLLAEKALAEGHFDLVIMDITMPEQDGLTTLRNIRSKGDNTLVILLTALGGMEDKITGLDIGADDYMAKPFEIDELLARVRVLLRRPQFAISEKLLCGNLILDRQSKRASRDDVDIKLSATEYRLLEFLMLNEGKVQSESLLLEHVWDQNYDGMSNVVAVYIRYLRNKIDKAFPKEEPLIKTVRGLGYTIDY